MGFRDYSPTQAGYRAWLEDGNKGTFQDFIRTLRAKKEPLIKEINAVLNNLTVAELEHVWAYLMRRYPTKGRK